MICNINLFKLLCLKNRLVSSANNINSVIFEVLTISFIKIRNSKETRIEPRGIPHEIGVITFILLLETLSTIC